LNIFYGGSSASNYIKIEENRRPGETTIDGIEPKYDNSLLQEASIISINQAYHVGRNSISAGQASFEQILLENQLNLKRADLQFTM